MNLYTAGLENLTRAQPIFQKGARNKPENLYIYKFNVNYVQIDGALCQRFDNDPHKRRKSFAMEIVWFHKWKIHHDTTVILS